MGNQFQNDINAGITTSSTQNLTLSGVDTAETGGGIIKIGTSAARVTADVADMKFISVYVDNGATSGDNRAMYLREYLTGAGGGGEAARVFTTIENVAAGTAHGAHISLNFASTGSVTGQGIAMRATLHVPNVAVAAGARAAVQAEIYSDGASSAVVANGATSHAFIRCVNGGNATGIADVDDNAFLLEISGGSVASGNMMAAVTGASVATHNLKMKGPDGTTYYILVSSTQ